MKQFLVFICGGALAALVAIGIAQGTTNSQGSSSTSGTKQTSTSSSGSAQGSSNASATSSASGQASGSAGGRQGGYSSSSGLAGGSGTSMAIPTHVITYVPATEAEASEDVVKEQSQFIDRLLKMGQVVMSGPWRDERGGMVLLNVRDDQTAQQIAAQSPIVVKGFYIADVKAWKVDRYQTGPRAPMPISTGIRP